MCETHTGGGDKNGESHIPVPRAAGETVFFSVGKGGPLSSLSLSGGPGS